MYTLSMEVTHMVIEYDEYAEARKVLRGGGRTSETGGGGGEQ